MKLVIAADIFPPQAGGPATYAAALAQALFWRGDHVVVVTLNPAADDTNRAWTLAKVSAQNKVLRYVQYVRLLFRHARQADAVYAMGPVNAGLPALVVAWVLRKKFVVKVVGDYAWEQGVQRCGVTDDIDSFQEKTGYVFWVRVLKYIEAFVVRRAHTVIVPSKYLQHMVHGWGARHVEVIYNAIELPAHTEKDSPAKSTETFSIVTAARLVPWKGIAVLIDVVAELRLAGRQVILHVIGEGPERASIEKRIAEKNLEQAVLLYGRLKREETLAHIARADVFVLNSGYEGLSHVLVEALAFETPVLASDRGGNPELIDLCGGGDIFAYNHGPSISAALERLITSRADAQKKRSANFFDLFSFDAMIEKTRTLLGAPSGGTALNVCMLSIDKTLVGKEGVGNAIERHRGYGAHLGHLDIITYTAQDEGKKMHISDRVTSYPTRSVHKFFFPVDAFRLFKRIQKKYRSDVIVTQDPFLLGFTGWWIKKSFGPKLIVGFHGDFWDNRDWLQERMINHIFLRLSRFVVRRADGVRAVSHRIAEKLIAAGIPQEKIAVIPTAVDLTRFSEAALVPADLPVSVGTKVVLFVGRLVAVKNIPLLLHAFARLHAQDAHTALVIVGDGPCREMLQTMVRALNLSGAVHFAGHVPIDAIPQYYAAASVCVLSSRSEGMPKVLVEAAASGLPLVSTDISGAEEIIVSGENGYLVSQEDPDALADALGKVLDGDTKHMGAISREIVRSKFGDTTEQLVGWWKQVLNQ